MEAPFFGSANEIRRNLDNTTLSSMALPV